MITNIKYIIPSVTRNDKRYILTIFKARAKSIVDILDLKKWVEGLFLHPYDSSCRFNVPSRVISEFCAKFLEFIRSSVAQVIYERYGFVPHFATS